MSAFFIFDNIEVIDSEKLTRYAESVAPIVEQYGGRYRVVGGEIEILEGEWSPVYSVIIEFESVEMAKAWYNSERYAPFKAMRHEAVKCNAVLIKGLT